MYVNKLFFYYKKLNDMLLSTRRVGTYLHTYLPTYPVRCNKWARVLPPTSAQASEHIIHWMPFMMTYSVVDEPQLRLHLGFALVTQYVRSSLHR